MRVIIGNSLGESRAGIPCTRVLTGLQVYRTLLKVASASLPPVLVLGSANTGSKTDGHVRCTVMSTPLLWGGVFQGICEHRKA